MAINRPKQTGSILARSLRMFLHLTFLGVGLGVITGSTLKSISLHENGLQSILSNWISTKKNPLVRGKKHGRVYKKSHINKLLKQANSQKAIKELNEKWMQIANLQKDLQASAYLLSLDDGRYAELNPNTSLPAASSIKIAILLAALELVDSGELRWNEPLKLTKELRGSGAGWMAYQPLGKSFPAHEVATEMIRVSDNTATNLLIDRIGGFQVLNERFRSLGLNSTVLNNWLPDLGGTNTTSAKDLALSIAMVDEGEILQQRTRDLFREIMSTSTSNRMLPSGLLRGLGVSSGDPDYNLLIKGYRVYNKTGDIGISYADAGLIQLPNNTRFVAGFIVKGPFNDPRSPRLIYELSAAMAPVLQAFD